MPCNDMMTGMDAEDEASNIRKYLVIVDVETYRYFVGSIA